MDHREGRVSTPVYLIGMFLILASGIVPLSYAIGFSSVAIFTDSQPDVNFYKAILKCFGVALMGYIICRPRWFGKWLCMIRAPLIKLSIAVSVASVIFVAAGVHMYDILAYDWLWAGPFAWFLLFALVAYVMGNNRFAVPYAAVFVAAGSWLYELPVANMVWSGFDWIANVSGYPVYPLVLNPSLICSVFVIALLIKYRHSKHVLIGVMFYASSVPFFRVCMMVPDLGGFPYAFSWWHRLPMVFMLTMLAVAISRHMSRHVSPDGWASMKLPSRSETLPSRSDGLTLPEGHP